MKLRVAMLFLLILLSLSACRTPAQAPPVAGNAPIRAMPGLNTDQIRTLGSLRKVDITYLGFGSNDVAALSTSSKRANLLNAPLLPFDGMNEYGLTVGMAAVPDAKEPIDAHKPTVGSLRIIRLMLDHARNTGEAI